MAITTFRELLSALRKQEGILEAQLGKVRDAMAALADVGKDYRVRQRVRRVNRVVRNARQVTSAQRKAASVRMKKYWAARRKQRAN
jgi:hypothetical protein